MNLHPLEPVAHRDLELASLPPYLRRLQGQVDSSVDASEDDGAEDRDNKWHFKLPKDYPKKKSEEKR